VYSPTAPVVAGLDIDVSVIATGLNKTSDVAYLALVDVTGMTLGENFVYLHKIVNKLPILNLKIY
jgi:hypothetical protein